MKTSLRQGSYFEDKKDMPEKYPKLFVVSGIAQLLSTIITRFYHNRNANEGYFKVVKLFVVTWNFQT